MCRVSSIMRAGVKAHNSLEEHNSTNGGTIYSWLSSGLRLVQKPSLLITVRAYSSRRTVGTEFGRRFHGAIAVSG